MSGPPLASIPGSFPRTCTRLRFPQDSAPLFLATPCAPRGYLPQVLPTLQSSGPASLQKEGGGRREGGGTPQGKGDLPLALMAANCGFLLAYWLSFDYAPPSSSDRPGHRLSAPVQHRLGGETPARDAGAGRSGRGASCRTADRLRLTGLTRW